MNDLLIRLKKAVDRALDLHASTRQIPLAEFPAYVVKSLEAVLADRDSDRTIHRLAALRVKVDEASRLAKQSAGTAEDTASPKITVPVFAEPSLTAQPKVESDTSPAAAQGALGASAVAGPNGMLGKALNQLRAEVTELKRLVGKQEDDERKPEDDEDEKKRKADASNEDDKAKEGGGGTRAGAKSEDDDKDKNKADVAKSISWPIDMNATMPGAEPTHKRDTSLDWGADPEAQGTGQAHG